MKKFAVQYVCTFFIDIANPILNLPNLYDPLFPFMTAMTQVFGTYRFSMILNTKHTENPYYMDLFYMTFF